MKATIHRAAERGKGEYGWLSTRYSFSFANWYEPARMGFGALRVINDDRIAPHEGFDTHTHQDMEIITFVTQGTLTHRDSMGNVGVLRAGEVQAMSAGTGVAHSEYNDSDEPLTLFQIWILPKTRGILPRYAERRFATGDEPGITLLAAPDVAPDALPINQDAYVSRAVLDAEHPLTYTVRKEGNGIYVFVVDGTVEAAGETLEARDAIGITESNTIEMRTPSKATTFIFEVPME